MRILGVSGSLQSRSNNLALIASAAAIAPDGMEVVVFDHLGEQPPFDPDADLPAGGAVDQWRQAARNGVLAARVAIANEGAFATGARAPMDQGK